MKHIREIINEPIGNPCKVCKGPCKVPRWVIYADGQNYMNDDVGQQYAITRAHRWFTQEWKNGIKEQMRPRTKAEKAEAQKRVVEKGFRGDPGDQPKRKGKK